MGAPCMDAHLAGVLNEQYSTEHPDKERAPPPPQIDVCLCGRLCV